MSQSDLSISVSRVTRTKWYQGCGDSIEGSEERKLELLENMEQTGDYYAQPKCDGIWAVIFGVHGKNIILSRNSQQKKLEELPFVGEGCAIVGELGYGSQEAATRKEKLGHGFIDVFDILYFEGGYVGAEPEAKRRVHFLEIWSLWQNLSGNKEYFNLLPVWLDGFADHYKQQPEGLVLKKKNNGQYICDSKNPGWIKVKKEYDWDMVVMDWELSDATTKSSVPTAKNIITGQYKNGKLTAMCKIGGLSLDLAEDIAQNFNSYKGEVVVVHGYSRFKSGAIRHPGFIRFRDDKLPAECVYKQRQQE